MKAVKENRVYTITEQDQKRFIAEGYDIKDDAGNVIAYGAGKTVPFGDYVKALETIKTLEAEIVELRKGKAVKEEAPKGIAAEEAPTEEKKKTSKSKSKK